MISIAMAGLADPMAFLFNVQCNPRMLCATICGEAACIEVSRHYGLDMRDRISQTNEAYIHKQPWCSEDVNH